MRRLKIALSVILTLLMTTPNARADSGSYSIELTHHGVPYQMRYTVEGVSDIKPTGPGLGSDGGTLEGYAAPNGTISVTMEWVKCGGDESDLEWKSIDVWMGNRGTNGDAMRGDDNQQFTKTARSYDNSLEKVTYTFPLSDFKKADPSVRDSTLLVSASSSLQIGASVTEVTVYLKIRLDSTKALHHREDNIASEEKGSTKYTIPVLIGGALIGGAGAVAAARKRKRKKKKSSDNPDNPYNPNNPDNPDDDKPDDDEPDDDEPDQLEMELYKDFGDTLMVGDAAERVSACIIRHPKEGPEYVDEQLTQQIEISADDDYLCVEDGGMVNGWKSAFVSAPQPGEDEEAPEEGIVKFRIANPQASYTNCIHFRIAQGQIVFGQDNLTMPAMYKECMYLPFIVVGMDFEDMAELPTVKITAVERNEETDYEARVEWDEKEGLFKIAIDDLWQDQEQLDTYSPGNCLRYFIEVEATSKHGFVVKGRMPLYRFYMGLSFEMDSNNLDCYLEEYDPLRHVFADGFITKQDGKEVTPHQTRVWLKAYDWDAENNKLIVANPAPKATDEFRVVAQNENQQEMIDKLKLQLVAITSSEGIPNYRIVCRGGVLNAPNRINAQIQVRCTLGDKDEEYVFRRDVRLISQPSRKGMPPRELVEAQKRDKQLLEVLERIDKEITAQGLGDRLAPLVHYIQLHIESFYADHDKEFGIDERSVRAIQKTYNNILVGEQSEAHQNLLACDNLQEVAFEFFHAMRTTIDDMGTFTKIFSCVASFGLALVVSSSIEVVGQMKDYVDKGGNSTFGMFCVGAKYVTKEYLTYKALRLSMKAAKKVAKPIWENVKKVLPQPKGNVKAAVTKEVNSAKGHAKRVAGAENSKVSNAQSAKKTDELLKKVKPTPRKPASYSQEAVKRGSERARENIDELQKAIDAVKKNPSEANILKRNSAVLKCQQDKQTMMLLKRQPGADAPDGVNFEECRRVLNTHLDRVYRATDASVKARLATLEGVKPSDIKVLNATSSAKAKLLSGQSVTFDRDITYYYVDKSTGQVRYFSQQATERIYYEEFQRVAKSGTEFSTGYWNVSNDAAKEFAKKMDQTVVEDVLHHSESYGLDLQRMINKSLQGEKLVNSEKVAEAVLYKGNERFYVAEKLLQAAEKSSDNAAKLNLQADAIGEMIEGCRQQVKVFDLLDSRDIARLCVNGSSKISSQLRDGIAVLRNLAVNGTTDITTAEAALKEMNLSFREISAELYRTVISIG